MEATNKIIRIYTDQKGRVPFNDWLESLDTSSRARIRARIDRLTLGNYGDYKAVGDGVKELRLNFGPGYRVYFAEEDAVIIILLCGGHKKTQCKDITRAINYWNQLKERSNE